jgi:hypothetical protein
MPRNFSWAVISILILVSGALSQSKDQASSDPAIEFRTLYNFTGFADGCCIYGGLASDSAGNLYGVAYLSENGARFGTLFKLAGGSNGYSFQILRNFSATEGECTSAPTIDWVSGNLFGVCSGYLTDGTLWEYSSQGTFSVLHTFTGSADGMSPDDSVALDAAGNICGTTYTYGPGGSGTLWEYSPSSGAFTLLHSFTDGNDGALLPAGPRLEAATGKLWGTTEFGPNCYYCGNGTVWNYDLRSGTFTTVLDLDNTDILSPRSRLAIDHAGNLFGTAYTTSQGNCGAVYELQESNNYAPGAVYQFTGTNGDGCDPFGNVRLDEQENVFGTTYDGGAFGGRGTVYKLKHISGAWQETILHAFDLSDGWRPQSGLITDGRGHWFGTTSLGGTYKQGTVFEISNVK